MNIDELSQETLWKLYAFISDGATDALPDAPNTSAREKGNATDQVTFLSVLPPVCVIASAIQELPQSIHSGSNTMYTAVPGARIGAIEVVYAQQSLQCNLLCRKWSEEKQAEPMEV